VTGLSERSVSSLGDDQSLLASRLSSSAVARFGSSVTAASVSSCFATTWLACGPRTTTLSKVPSASISPTRDSSLAIEAVITAASATLMASPMLSRGRPSLLQRMASRTPVRPSSKHLS
jgi:hypothetical protein